MTPFWRLTTPPAHSVALASFKRQLSSRIRILGFNSIAMMAPVSGPSIEELTQSLAHAVSRWSLQRRLAEWVDRPIVDRPPVAYQPEFLDRYQLNVTTYLPSASDPNFEVTPC